MNRNTLLPILLMFIGGMAVGSIHNAQARDIVPGITTPFGFVLIMLTGLVFVAGLVLYRYYDRPGTVKFGVALSFSAIALALELLNLGTTLMGEGTLAGWLFHEYAGVAVTILQFAKLLLEKR